MDPRSAVGIVHGVSPDRDPERFEELLKEMSKGTSPYDAAAAFAVQTVINPVDTRAYLIRALEVHRMRLSNGVGEHLMRTWPTSY